MWETQEIFSLVSFLSYMGVTSPYPFSLSSFNSSLPKHHFQDTPPPSHHHCWSRERERAAFHVGETQESLFVVFVLYDMQHYFILFSLSSFNALFHIVISKTPTPFSSSLQPAMWQEKCQISPFYKNPLTFI